MTYFIVKDSSILGNAIAFISKLDFFKPWLIDIKPYKKNRSTAQNRLYWKWLEIISAETGYTRDELHELFKRVYLGSEDKIILGKQINIAKSTTGLSTTDFTNFLISIEAEAMDLGITLPHPQDYQFIMGGK